MEQGQICDGIAHSRISAEPANSFLDMIVHAIHATLAELQVVKLPEKRGMHSGKTETV